jgi:hypothetical protein
MQMSHEVILEEVILEDEAAREATTSNEPNLIEHALSHGHPKQQCVSLDQANRIDELISNPPPPTHALRRAMMRAHRFTFIP